MKLEELLKQCISMGASQLHLSWGQPPTLRVHGKLQAIQGQPLLDQELLLRLLAPFRDAGHPGVQRLGPDRYLLGGPGFWWVALCQQRGDVTQAVFKPRPAQALSRERLDLPPAYEELWGDGLTLVSGPCDSGKSATLACLVDRLNREEVRSIVVLEERPGVTHQPRLSLICQRTRGWDFGDWEEAARAACDMGADVLVMDEIDCAEAARGAVLAAGNGLQVLAAVRARDAQQAVLRFGLGSVVRAVLHQVLVPVLGKATRLPATEGLLEASAERSVFELVGLPGKRSKSLSWALEESLVELLDQERIGVDEALAFCAQPERLLAYLRKTGRYS